MKKLVLLLILLTSLFLVTNCKDDNDEINSPIDLFEDMYDNIPVIVNTENSFTFTVVANELDYSYKDNLNFDNDSLVVTITLTNASSNSSTLKLFNNNDETIFSESLNESKVLVNTELNNEKPRSVQIELLKFTGQLTIVVALKIP